MPSHHSIVGCISAYKQTQEWPSTEFEVSFHYLFSKPELLQKLITFMDWKDWTLNSFQRDVWGTFSWRFYESRVTKSQPYPNEERTSLWKAIAQWTKHWIMEKTTIDQKFGARSLAWFQVWRLNCISSNAEIEGKHCPPAFQIRNIEDSITFYKIKRLCLMSEISSYFSSNQHQQRSACKASNQWYSCSPSFK